MDNCVFRLNKAAHYHQEHARSHYCDIIHYYYVYLRTLPMYIIYTSAATKHNSIKKYETLHVLRLWLRCCQNPGSGGTRSVSAQLRPRPPLAANTGVT